MPFKVTAVTCIAISVLVGGTTLVWISAREPSLRGKRLTEWVEQYDLARWATSSDVTGAYRRQAEAEKAIHDIGSKAAPTLVRLVKSRSHFRDVSSRDHAKAVVAFGVLGRQATNAFADLLSLSGDSDPDVRLAALSCLRELDLDGPAAGIAFTPFLVDPDRNIRFLAAEALAEFPTEAERAGVYKTYPGLRRLAPESENPDRKR